MGVSLDCGKGVISYLTVGRGLKLQRLTGVGVCILEVDVYPLLSGWYVDIWDLREVGSYLVS